jgi:hypothetical protein
MESTVVKAEFLPRSCEGHLPSLSAFAVRLPPALCWLRRDREHGLCSGL